MGAASMRVEEVDEEEEQRQVELGRAKEHLTKRLADEDYQAAADTQAHITALTSVGHGSRPARSHVAASSLGSRGANAMPDEEVEEEEEKRQAELRHAHERLNKCIADEDYSSAAALQRHVAALQSVESCSQRDHGRSKAGRSLATATGHGSVLATGRSVPTADVVRPLPCKRSERADAVVEEHRQAKRRRAEERLKKCVADDYQGATDAQADITALTSAGHGSRARVATAMRAEEVDEEVENRRAKLRCARDELSK